MKRLDVVAHLQEQLTDEAYTATLNMLIEKQIEGIEKLIEGSGSRVKDPGAYNVVAGLLDQLRYFCLALYLSPEFNLDNMERKEGTPAVLLPGGEPSPPEGIIS